MNAGGLAEGIAESELFGHVKGAFTDARVDRIGCFELADDGTLFLDEIANMPMRLQAKLLRVLQTGEMQRVGSSRVRYVNVRVLSATNADCRRDRRRPVSRGSALPAEHRRHPSAAAARPARLTSMRSPRISSPLRSAVSQADRRIRRRARARCDARWPGNVRELAHAIERAVLMADPGTTRISLRAISACSRGRGRSATPIYRSRRRSGVFIEKVLARHNGDVRLAAQQLGMSRSALYRRLQQYGVRE